MASRLCSEAQAGQILLNQRAWSAVEELVGLQVIEVNIEIIDVYVPGPAKPGTAAETRPAREAIQ